jgi:hypothetical protein
MHLDDIQIGCNENSTDPGRSLTGYFTLDTVDIHYYTWPSAFIIYGTNVSFRAKQYFTCPCSFCIIM